jgi:hypothetical protein
MYATVKTIYHTHLELLKALNKPFTVIEHSTLNEKFGIEANTLVEAGAYPELSYIAIGRGGHRGRMTAGGSTLIDILQHNIKHAALYEHLPFIMREVGNDLAPSVRQNYGMRRLEEHNGTQYFVYYLKKINYESSYPEIKELLVSDGEVTDSEYIPLPAQLNPVPIPYSNTTVNTSSGKHISVQSTIEIKLTETDIAEIIAAVEIIYGDTGFATISEIAAVTASIQTVSTTVGGLNVSYDEAIAAQIANFIPANIDLKFTTKEISNTYSLGNISPYVT